MLREKMENVRVHEKEDIIRAGNDIWKGPDASSKDIYVGEAKNFEVYWGELSKKIRYLAANFLDSSGTGKTRTHQNHLSLFQGHAYVETAKLLVLGVFRVSIFRLKLLHNLFGYSLR